RQWCQSVLRSPTRVSFSTRRRPSTSTLFPYTTLFRSRLLGRRRGHPSRGQRNGTVPRNFVWDSPGGSRDRKGRWRRNGSDVARRSEEHTSELQSRENLVCRLLLEKKNEQAERQRR